MRTVRIKAPAKINLHLETGALREDGFHPIISLFQAVSLFDTLEFSLTSRAGEITIDGAFDCPPQSNLIYKAVDLFRRKCGDSRGICVRVDKRIPSQAGLGGGSSDAAAALKALVLLLETDPGEDALMEMAAALGSDVPFFMKSPAAAVTGRGEILEDMGMPLTLEGLIVKGEGDGISTAAAYRAVDEAMALGKLNQGLLSKEDMMQSYRSLPPSQWPFYNSFMETFRNHIKPIEFIYKLLYDSGAVFSGLSGSGSALFGIFTEQGLLQNAETALKQQFPFVERFYFLNGNPEAVVI
ncbi:MAG: 4-(cytidine 5'-diphospho)-2-C-methyl-D-erythritol kinase [Spirochaetales bacterium]|nr:4-(cytidine 5'-diphospho)-2-C-methyl-D-erythritol kinase [Spirochaetales bacterium]